MKWELLFPTMFNLLPMQKYLYFLLSISLLISCQNDVEPMNPIEPVTGEGTLYYCSRTSPSSTWQVKSKNLETNEITDIASDPDFNYWWVVPSPDESQLLLLRSPKSSPRDQFDYDNCEMIRSNANGSNQVVIVSDNQNDWFAFGNPHWHPTGDRILMIAQLNNTMEPFYTYTIDLNGNNPKALTTQYSLDANWSPQGDKITFIGIDASGFTGLTSFEVFTADYNYSANSISSITQLTADDTRNHDPCFSPDGSQIAFSASDANLTNADIVTIDVSGNNRKAVLDDNGIHGGPLNWGTDNRIYLHSLFLGNNFTVDAFDMESNTNEVLLTSSSEGFISPYYSN